LPAGIAAYAAGAEAALGVLARCRHPRDPGPDRSQTAVHRKAKPPARPGSGPGPTSRQPGRRPLSNRPCRSREPAQNPRPGADPRSLPGQPDEAPHDSGDDAPPYLYSADEIAKRCILFEHARDGVMPKGRAGLPLGPQGESRTAAWLNAMTAALPPSIAGCPDGRRAGQPPRPNRSPRWCWRWSCSGGSTPTCSPSMSGDRPAATGVSTLQRWEVLRLLAGAAAGGTRKAEVRPPELESQARRQ
jgi:hypothetical protein